MALLKIRHATTQRSSKAVGRAAQRVRKEETVSMFMTWLISETIVPMCVDGHILIVNWVCQRQWPR